MYRLHLTRIHTNWMAQNFGLKSGLLWPNMISSPNLGETPINFYIYIVYVWLGKGLRPIPIFLEHFLDVNLLFITQN